MLIQNRYSRYGKTIGRALEAHATFRELCRDYQICAMALEDWQKASGTGSMERIREYEALLSELDREIEAWLDALSTGESVRGEPEGRLAPKSRSCSGRRAVAWDQADAATRKTATPWYGTRFCQVGNQQENTHDDKTIVHPGGAGRPAR